jgi:hypothetical protein
VASALIAYCQASIAPKQRPGLCPFTRHGFTERGEGASLLMPTGRQIRTLSDIYWTFSVTSWCSERFRVACRPRSTSSLVAKSEKPVTRRHQASHSHVKAYVGRQCKRCAMAPTSCLGVGLLSTALCQPSGVAVYRLIHQQNPR